HRGGSRRAWASGSRPGSGARTRAGTATITTSMSRCATARSSSTTSRRGAGTHARERKEPDRMTYPSRETFLLAAVAVYGLAVIFGIVGVNQRLNLVALGLALATLAQLRG